MIKEIKQITFNFEEFNPDEKGLYNYNGNKYTYREFVYFLKNSLIWFYVNKVKIDIK